MQYLKTKLVQFKQWILSIVMASIYCEIDGIKYRIGDKVKGEFASWDDSEYGIVCFGEFDAYFPTGAHEWAGAYGFFVKTNKHVNICHDGNNMNL